MKSRKFYTKGTKNVILPFYSCQEEERISIKYQIVRRLQTWLV